MNFYEIITTVYADAWKLNQFTLCQHNETEGVVIQSWNVPNIIKPTHAEVMAMATPELEKTYKLNQFIINGMPLIENYIDLIAQQKQYDSALSCSSYSNSTNIQWKSEADVFIAWRDLVYAYTIAQVSLMESGQRSIPSFDEFKTELPLIVWP